MKPHVIKVAVPLFAMSILMMIAGCQIDNILAFIAGYFLSIANLSLFALAYRTWFNGEGVYKAFAIFLIKLVFLVPGMYFLIVEAKVSVLYLVAGSFCAVIFLLWNYGASLMKLQIGS